MKKTIYLFGLLLLAGAMVFTACKKDDDDPTPIDYTPVLTFIGGTAYVSADADMTVGSTFKAGINASENETSKKNIETFKVVRTFNNVPVTVFEEDNISEPNYTWEDDSLIANAVAGEERWTFTVTDKDGVSKEISFIITTVAAVTPLGNPEALTWERVGGDPATGLDMFGLKWTSNVKEVMAQIEKDAADKFVQLTAAEWTSMTTVEELAAAVEAGTGIDTYAGISAEVPQSYDEVLATKYNGEYFLIHLTNATIEVLTQGTTITITGEYEK